MRYPTTIVGERETPAEQCMRTLSRAFLDRNAALMISTAALRVVVIEEDGESLSERRWYVMPSSFREGLIPILKTVVIELEVRNAAEEADERGPR
jgi:hypothetical protein